METTKKDSPLATDLVEMKEIKKIGQRIAFYRKQRKLTQQELAEKANVSKSYLSKIESSEIGRAHV